MIKNFLVSLGFVAVYNLFLFKTGWGLGFSLLILLLNLCFFLFKDNKARNIYLGYVSSVVAIVFGCLISYRANEVVQLANILVSLLFSVTALYFYKEENTFKFLIPSFLLIPFNVLAKAFTSIPDSLSQKKEDHHGTKNEIIKSLIKGLIFAVPVLIVLAIVLISADPVFGKLADNLLKNIHERIIISLLLFVPLFALSLIKLKEKVSFEKEEIKQLIHKGYELSVVLGGIALLFGAFIVVQSQYLFSSLGERQLEQLGITSLTYSEYVNKGFFELMIATVISIGVLSYVLTFIKRITGNEKKIIQVLSSAVILETFLIILSAAQRVNLYQIEHGLTRARIFGTIFLVYLTILLVIYLFHLFINMSQKKFFYSMVSSVLLFFLSINLINIDGMIATTYKPTVNKEIDYTYLSYLSPDAYMVWPEIINNIDSAVATIETKRESMTDDDKRKYSYAKIELYQLEKKYKEQIINSRWQELNLSKYQALQLSLDKKEEFGLLGELRQRVSQIETEFGPILNIYSVDRDTTPPLVH